MCKRSYEGVKAAGAATEAAEASTATKSKVKAGKATPENDKIIAVL